MKPTTELFDLIKSLTQTEKRYFKISASVHFKGDDNKYLLLFDTIDEQESYDEKNIRLKFKGERFLNQLHVAKNYLYNTILKTLRSYTSEKNKIVELQALIRNIEILYDKSLFAQCRKLIIRAKELATDYERFSELYQIIDLEKSLARSSAYADVKEEELNNLYEQQKTVLEKLSNINDYWQLSTKAFLIKKKFGAPRNETERKFFTKLLDDPLLKNEKLAITYISRSIFHNIRGLYFHTLKDQKNLLKECKSMISLMESNQLLLKKDNYISALYNLIIVQIDTAYYSEALETIKKMRMVESTSDALNSKIFFTSYDTEVNVYLRTGEFKKGIGIVPDIEAGLKSFRNKINQEALITLYFNLAYLYFGAGKFEKSLEWVNKILNDKDISLRKDVKGFARILNLLIHLELGNYELIDSEIKSTKRFLENNDLFTKTENLLLNTLRNYINEEESKRDELLEILLHKLSKEDNNDQQQDYFDFKAWLKAKIDKQTMNEVFSSRIKKARK